MGWIILGVIVFAALSIALALGIGKMIKQADDRGY